MTPPPRPTPLSAAPGGRGQQASALDLFLVDPVGLGGVVLRGGPSPARDRWLAALAACLHVPPRRLPPGIDDARLLGGLDVAATLAAGRPVAAGGLLAEAEGGVVIVPMAERIGDGLAGRLTAMLDTHEVVVERDGATARSPARVALVLLDEGVEDERVPDALAERLAFHVEQDDAASPPEPAAVVAARERLAGVGAASDEVLAAICATAGAFGVDSARAVVFALLAARASAALAERTQIAEADLAAAARLVLAPRATRLPPLPEPEDEAPPPPDNPGEREDEETAPGPDALTELVLAAVRAALPANLLASGPVKKSRRRGGVEGGRGAGERRLSWRRGRPTGTRAGQPGGGKRLAVAATLTAAAVWQRARRGTVAGPVVIRASDLRIRRFETRAEATVIVAVDASGSAALARLAEAKGAVELLLAQAYVLRTQVALIAFRGSAAEVLLPPTRSLTRARRVLGELAGGGGTPLAAGLDAALALALNVRGKGRTPRIVLLTDGRGNVARAPDAGRAQAELDATQAARLVRAAGIATILIDTAPRPRPATAELAAAMGARYVALPRLDAEAVAKVAAAA